MRSYLETVKQPRRHIGVWVVLVIAIIIGAVYLKDSVWIFSAKLNYSKTATAKTTSVVWPNYGSGRIEVVGFSNNTIDHGNQTARPMASITKVITALVVLDRKPLDGSSDDGPTIYLSSADQRIYNQAVANNLAVRPVSTTGVISEKEAMQIMLMASAANYAETLAVWAYGSVDEYLVAAKAWLKENNLLDTRVVDTTGLDPADVSTPTDLVKLGKLALQNKAVANIVSTKQVDIEGVGEINSGNRVLGKLGVNGIKTGFTGDAGACLLFSSQINIGGKPIEIIGNLLGGDDGATVAGDVEKLLKSVQSNLSYKTIISKNQVIGEVRTFYGQKKSIIAKQNISSVMWSDVPVKISVSVNSGILARVGEKAGEITVNANGKILNSDLIYK